MDKNDTSKKDAWLLELYEGPGASPNAESDSAEEAVALRAMKDWLDARSAIRRSAQPDPEALEAVWAAAQQASSSGARKDRPGRPDRPARRGGVRRRLSRRMAVGGLVAMLGMLALVGLFRWDALAPASPDADGRDAPAGSAVAETVVEAPPPAGEGEAGVADVQPGAAASVAAPPETVRSPEPLADAAPAADGTLQAAVETEQADLGAPAAVADIPAEIPADIPAWDDPTDVMYLQQRIQRIGDGVADGWDAPVLPLEMLPPGSGDRGLVPASERR